jgi:hypothetical protein
VASRATPVRTDPGAGSSWLSPGFPDRDTCPDAPPPASCPDGVLVAIDVHGSEDQEKDASTADQESHVSVVLVSGACTSKSTCGRNVPFLSTLWTSAVAGASPRGEEPVPDGGPNQGLRSDAVPRRTTPSRRPGCLPPLRSAPSVRARISPHPNLARRSLAHAAHTFSPGMGRVPSRALQAPECGHPRSLAFEEQAPLVPRGSRSFRICRAWD